MHEYIDMSKGRVKQIDDENIIEQFQKSLTKAIDMHSICLTVHELKYLDEHLNFKDKLKLKMLSIFFISQYTNRIKL